jgi:hypothetical protein
MVRTIEIPTTPRGPKRRHFRLRRASTIVGIARPQAGIDMSLLGLTGSVGAGGDPYTGLDQFGRVVSLQWIKASGITVGGCNSSDIAARVQRAAAHI